MAGRLLHPAVNKGIIHAVNKGKTHADNKGTKHNENKGTNHAFNRGFTGTIRAPKLENTLGPYFRLW